MNGTELELRDEAKILLARYQLCINVAERKRIQEELRKLRSDLLCGLRASCETWEANLAETVQHADTFVVEHRAALETLKSRMNGGNGNASSRIDALPEITTVERVHQRQDFFTQFLAAEDKAHPSESRPDLVCPKCEVRGFVRFRSENGNRQPLTALKRRLTRKPPPGRAYCLNCTETWPIQP